VAVLAPALGFQQAEDVKGASVNKPLTDKGANELDRMLLNASLAGDIAVISEA